jgi:hypothetical protein
MAVSWRCVEDVCLWAFFFCEYAYGHFAIPLMLWHPFSIIGVSTMISLKPLF